MSSMRVYDAWPPRTGLKESQCNSKKSAATAAYAVEMGMGWQVDGAWWSYVFGGHWADSFMNESWMISTFVCSQFFPQPRLRRSSPCWPSRMTSSSGGKTSRWRQTQHALFTFVSAFQLAGYGLQGMIIIIQRPRKYLAVITGDITWQQELEVSGQWSNGANNFDWEYSIVNSCFNVQLDCRFCVNNTKRQHKQISTCRATMIADHIFETEGGLTNLHYILLQHGGYSRQTRKAAALFLSKQSSIGESPACPTCIHGGFAHLVKRRMWAVTLPTIPRPHSGHILCRSRNTMFSVRSDIPDLAKKLIKPWPLVASMTRIVLRSHSRPSEVPLFEQNRMLQRSRAEFASPTGQRSNDWFFLLTPTGKDKHQTLGRGEKTAKVRMQLKKSISPRQLLQLFHNALQDGKVDASVVGAALQRCGQGLWWNALIEIRELQEQHGIVLHCIEHNIFKHAFASCLKCRKCTVSQLNNRKAKAFRLAREIWGHPVPSNAADFNCALSSAFQVCVRVGSSEAFTWADELWTWSEGQPFEKSMVTYTARMFVYEMQGRHTEVDATLKLCSQRTLIWMQLCWEH